MRQTLPPPVLTPVAGDSCARRPASLTPRRPPPSPPPLPFPPPLPPLPPPPLLLAPLLPTDFSFPLPRRAAGCSLVACPLLPPRPSLSAPVGRPSSLSHLTSSGALLSATPHASEPYSSVRTPNMHQLLVTCCPHFLSLPVPSATRGPLSRTARRLSSRLLRLRGGTASGRWTSWITAAGELPPPSPLPPPSLPSSPPPALIVRRLCASRDRLPLPPPPLSAPRPSSVGGPIRISLPPPRVPLTRRALGGSGRTKWSLLRAVALAVLDGLFGAHGSCCESRVSGGRLATPVCTCTCQEV